MNTKFLHRFNKILVVVVLTIPVSLAQSIAGGWYHSIYSTAGGAVYAWGSNSEGQLGNGNNTKSNIPVAVDMSGALSGKTITAVACGGSHTVALASDGTVFAWGDNYYGQLGNANNTKSNVPVAVDMSGALSGKTVTAIACGGNHTVVLAFDGTVYAWGKGGTLGNGNDLPSNTPVAVDMSGALSGKTVTAIACGSTYTVVLTSGGAVYAWGDNINGQLGNGNNTKSNVPVAVDVSGVLSGKTIKAVACGFLHTIALATDGTVYAWGSGVVGQLGNGNNTNSNVPVMVDMLGALSGKSISAVASGVGNHTVALAADETIYAWGYNPSGQLGNGHNITSNVPVAVDMSGALSGKTITKVACGENHSIALASDGTVYTWGYNTDGELGTGNYLDSNIPVAVVNGGTTGIEDNFSQTPTNFLLVQNYPNPFNPSTKIEYSIPKEAFVTLRIYNVLGQLVAELQNNDQTAGTYAITFNAERLSSGIYFCTIRAGDFIQTKKMVLLK